MYKIKQRQNKTGKTPRTKVVIKDDSFTINKLTEENVSLVNKYNDLVEQVDNVNYFLDIQREISMDEEQRITQMCNENKELRKRIAILSNQLEQQQEQQEQSEKEPQNIKQPIIQRPIQNKVHVPSLREKIKQQQISRTISNTQSNRVTKQNNVEVTDKKHPFLKRRSSTLSLRKS